jgi:hypothetical protein
MSTVELTDEDVKKAQQIWDRYAAEHDVSDRVGQAAGIDPHTGEIWFGESMTDIVRQLDAANAFRPLFYVRVGYKTYLRKGGRR